MKEVEELKEEISNSKLESLKYLGDQRENQKVHMEIVANMQNQIEALKKQIREQSPRGVWFLISS